MAILGADGPRLGRRGLRRRRARAARLAAQQGQLDRGRHLRDPAQHHRQARARPARLRRSGSVSEGTNMSLVYNDDERMLAEAAHGFLQQHAPPAALRRLRDTRDADGFSRELWHEMAALGWAGMLVPEEYGGLGFAHTGAGHTLRAGRAHARGLAALRDCHPRRHAAPGGGTEAQKKHCCLPSPQGGCCARSRSRSPRATTRRELPSQRVPTASPASLGREDAGARRPRRGRAHRRRAQPRERRRDRGHQPVPGRGGQRGPRHRAHRDGRQPQCRDRAPGQCARRAARRRCTRAGNRSSARSTSAASVLPRKCSAWRARPSRARSNT